jgi:7-cyano-7-deazaguanine synthase
MTIGAAESSRGERPKAVVLLSGGLDSATVLALAVAERWECHALTIVYGQRHSVEVERARKLAAVLGASGHREVTVDLASFGGSSLVGEGDIPRNCAAPERSERDASSDPRTIPSTYVPARNLVFLALATAMAEAVGAEAVFIGVNALDYSGYPDCRADFVEAFQNAAMLGTRCGREGCSIVVKTPLLSLTKAQIITLGTRLGVDFALTLSCYAPAPDGSPCGSCESCTLRARGFAEAGLTDPVTRPQVDQYRGVDRNRSTRAR